MAPFFFGPPCRLTGRYFQTFSTGILCSKYEIKDPVTLQRVATLPCEIHVYIRFCISELQGRFSYSRVYSLTGSLTSLLLQVLPLMWLMRVFNKKSELMLMRRATASV